MYLALEVSLLLVLLLFGFVEPQTAVFSITSENLNDCTATSEYFDFGSLTCRPCPDSVGMRRSIDGFSCRCKVGYRADISDPRVLTCTRCATDVTTPDGYFCSTCSGNGTSSDGLCVCEVNNELDVSYENATEVTAECVPCTTTFVSTQGQSCVPCPECCDTALVPGGLAFGQLCFTAAQRATLSTISVPRQPVFINQNLAAAFGACSAQASLRNQTACEQLANMCVMQRYLPTSPSCAAYLSLVGETGNIATTADSWQTLGFPWLYYTAGDSEVMSDDGIDTVFRFTSTTKLELFAAQYRANGTYLGTNSVEGGLIQMCKDSPAIMNAAYAFGTTFRSSCSVDASALWNDVDMANVYIDLFLKFTDAETGVERLYAIPVLVSDVVGSNGGLNSNLPTNQWQLVRRFFLIDNIFGVNLAQSPADPVRYAASMSLEIQLAGNGQIFPPLLKITYQDVAASVLTQSGSTVPVSFSVTYSSDASSQNEGLRVTLPLFGSLAFLYAMIETSGWRRRQGLPYIEVTTLLQFLLYLMGNLANAFFVVLLGYTSILLIFFKRQDTATSYIPSEGSEQERLFIIFFSIAFGFKFVQVFMIILQQCAVDVFLIDWERPRAKTDKISIWRTYFIANEWNEIQTCRKINNTFQLFAVLLFLEVIGFKDLALLYANSDLNADEAYQPPSSRMLRFAIGGLVYLIIAVVQVIYFKLIHGRFISDRIRDFVDLCSVSNVSVFVLSQRGFGYYIHGRSVHGKADTDMTEMNQMLKREEQNLVSTRGLITGSEDQVFEIMIPPRMRQQYDKIYQPLLLMKTQPAARGGNSDIIAVESMKAHSTMKVFLTSFIDHSLRDLDYIVKDKMFLEKLLGIEFQEPIDKAFFTVDDGYSFANLLFYGRETALLILDILLFCMIDYGAADFVLAAIITYVVGGILRTTRQYLGRYNLARKTLTDKRFLI